MPKYNDRQIIFALNSIANLPSNRIGPADKLEAEARETITDIFENTEIINLIGKWQLAWGPKVYQRKGPKIIDVADNSMYVAQNLSQPSQFVVAISGTNPISLFGWLIEDIDISPPVAWPYGERDSITGSITNGTNIGMKALLNDMKDNDLTLFKYLASQVSRNDLPLSVTVTGHSLGGALSPVTALALLDSQGVPLDEPNGWDPESKSKISVTPSAGPTPGDEVWQEYYDSKLGLHTDRIWNSIDIVPHAWQICMLSKIPAIYTPTIPPPGDISTLVCGAINKSCHFQEKNGGKSLVQIRPNVPGLCGKVDPTKKNFLAQALHQHVEAYSELLCTTEFDQIVKGIKMGNLACSPSCSMM